MLSTSIIYNENKSNLIKEVLEDHQFFNKADSSFSYLSKNFKELATAINEETATSLTIRYNGTLTFKEYELLHHLILSINAKINGEIDDSKSLLGYLENGEPAYIITNWDNWTMFLNKAKHVSMEGQKVKVYNEVGLEVASGLLVGYDSDQTNNEKFIITSCTLVTLFGEKTYTGKQLIIEPTGEL
ncbi:hypothetical protein IM538_14495 [Cytobacillus suaedae]|nr:hypothetical protein IM538_14495 [Cytobacillus suaedae]